MQSDRVENHLQILHILKHWQSFLGPTIQFLILHLRIYFLANAFKELNSTFLHYLLIISSHANTPCGNWEIIAGSQLCILFSHWMWRDQKHWRHPFEKNVSARKSQPEVPRSQIQHRLRKEDEDNLVGEGRFRSKRDNSKQPPGRRARRSR